jgi:phosphohistidine phosphatase
MARRLVEVELTPDLVIASSARRTQQTAEILARELGLAPRQVRYEESLYLAPAADILAIVHTIGPRVPHLMVVGHNPGISELAHQLAREHRISGLATAAVCSLTFDSPTWPDVRPGTASGLLSEAPPTGLFSFMGG